ncbi:hypothetical protein NM208_g15236 [Fusarium decemcellulare]|uniref:Uncharacterized protein n=1 Tax=Fusarium decemcellulare TaxID=57161 RepID=A0ACC1RDR2_9HYPO|nr:hypothetical protein NM208_g15236 [Fusarium decemcellulare]
MAPQMSLVAQRASPAHHVTQPFSISPSAGSVESSYTEEMNVLASDGAFGIGHVTGACWGTIGTGGAKSSRCGGKEVYEVPLCAACVVESEVDGVREESVIVQTGLRRVERVDGGLTRRRWEAKEGEKRGLTSSTVRASSHKSSGDGTAGEEAKACNTATKPTDPSDSVIWVDIFDPINGPSFKPSPLKPIPLFMQRPPNPAVVAQHQPHPADVHLQTPPPLSKSASAPCSVYPPASSVTSLRLRTHNTSQPTVPIPAGPAYRSPTPSRGHDARLPPAPPSEYITDTGSLDLRHKQAFTLVKEEPLKRPSSRLAP